MKKVIIYNIKNIQSMTFIIPDPGLHIIAGKNGSGKTTLFTCLSRICNNNAFRVGFPSKSNDTYDLFTGSIEYHVDNNSVTYTRRRNGEWRPNTKNSTVLSEFRYPSVINITTKDKRVFSQENIYPRQRRNTDEWLNQKLNRIFDTDRLCPPRKNRQKTQVKNRMERMTNMVLSCCIVPHLFHGSLDNEPLKV